MGKLSYSINHRAACLMPSLLCFTLLFFLIFDSLTLFILHLPPVFSVFVYNCGKIKSRGLKASPLSSLERCVWKGKITSICVHVCLVRGMLWKPGPEPGFLPELEAKGDQRKESNEQQQWSDGFLRARERSQCACLWWTKAPWVPISVVSLWRWQLAVDHHPAHTCTHRHKLTPRLWIRFNSCANSYEMFLFFLHHTSFSNIIFRRHYSNTSPPLHVPSERPVLFAFTCSRSRLSLHPLSHASVLSECRHLPVLVVMILSERLVSCQTHRIYSGLFPMLTLMFLFFTRKEENGSVLEELLSTNTL